MTITEQIARALARHFRERGRTVELTVGLDGHQLVFTDHGICGVVCF